MSSDNVYPFASPLQTNTPSFFNNDVVISKPYPGLVETPTELGGVYVAFREVNGCSWWVVNADWDPNQLFWTQPQTCNPALPAFALELCGDGTFIKYAASPTLVLNTPVTWVQQFNFDANGNFSSTPAPTTGPTTIPQDVTVTWSAGLATIQYARQVNATDTASSSATSLDTLSVNNTVVWNVDKTGTLTVGNIPFARITGFIIPSGTVIDNGIFTGTSTFEGPVVMQDGLSVTGGITTDNLTVTNNETVDGNLHVVGHETVDGGLTVTGGETVDSLNVTGSASLPASTFPVDSIAGANGVVVTNAGNAYTVSGGTLVQTVESTDGSIGVTVTGQTVDLSVQSVPIAPGATYVNTEFHLPGVATTGGGVSLGPLPGPNTVSYRIMYFGVAALKDASSDITVTGTASAGVSWDQATVTYFNGQANAFPFMYFGTAEGGSTPAVTWACAPGEYIFQTPFFAIIQAAIQL